jgi:hypothetical protein
MKLDSACPSQPLSNGDLLASGKPFSLEPFGHFFSNNWRATTPVWSWSVLH